MTDKPHGTRARTTDRIDPAPDGCVREILASATDAQKREILVPSPGGALRAERIAHASPGELKQALRKNAQGNSIEDVFSRIQWLVRRFAISQEADPPDWSSAMDSQAWKHIDESEFNKACCDGFDLAPEQLGSPETWGDFALAIWKCTPTPLLPVTASEGGDERRARQLMIEIIGSLSPAAANSLTERTPLAQAVPRRSMRRAWNRIVVAFGSDLGLDTRPHWHFWRCVELALTVVCCLAVVGAALGIGFAFWKLGGLYGLLGAIAVISVLSVFSRARAALMALLWAPVLLCELLTDNADAARRIGHLHVGELADAAVRAAGPPKTRDGR